MWYLLRFETVVCVVLKFMNVKAKVLRDTGFKMRDSRVGTNAERRTSTVKADEPSRYHGLFLSPVGLH